MNFFMNLLMLLMAVLSVSARASPESCPLLKRRLMQTFQVQASEATISGRQAEVSSCNVIEFYSFNQAEFEDCLSQVSGDEVTEGEDILSERRECFRLFWHEVDANGDQKVDKDEFIRWKKLGVLDLLLESTEKQSQNTTASDEDGIVVLVGDLEYQLSSRQGEFLSAITQALQNDNPLEAFVQLFRLMTQSSGNDFNTNILIPLSEVMQTIIERTVAGTAAQAISVVTGLVLGGQEAAVAASQDTIAAINGLIRAVVGQNLPDAANQIFNTVVNLVTDLTPIASETVTDVTNLIRSLFDRDVSNNNSEGPVREVITSLSRVLTDINGVGNETRDAIVDLAQAISFGTNEDILDHVSLALRSVLGQGSAIGQQAAETLTSIMRALASENRLEAFIQTSNLYRLMTNGAGICQNGHFLSAVALRKV